MLVAVSLISTSQCTDQHRVLFVSLQPLQAQSKNSQECEWQDWSTKVPSLLHTLSPPCDFPLTTFRLVQFKLYSEFKFNLNPNSIFSFSSPFFLFTFQTYHKFFLNLTDSLKNFCTHFSQRWCLGSSAHLFHGVSQTPPTLYLSLTIHCLPFTKMVVFIFIRESIFILDSYVAFLAISLSYLYKT